ncbi:prepilin-type N-terminal cleavage/methylation domain-containing protein [bacterium]|nr:prepilin-type N-terminal cleavage/methylation domain-containing protein [bacterium]
MKRRKGFTLVEVMIAVVLSTMIAFFLLQIYAKFQKDATELTGKVAAARDANIVLQKIRMVLRGARDLEITGTGISGKNSKGELFQLEYRPDKQGVEWTNPPIPKDKILGNRKIYKFEILQPIPAYPGIYQLVIHYKNPESRVPSEENALVFRSIVSERVPYGDRIPDPSWVMNSKDDCPPSCN